MPFYRCVMGTTSGGDSSADDYVYYMDNGEKTYLPLPMGYIDVNASIHSSYFNKPVVVGNHINSMVNSFEGCSEFNSPISIANSVTNMRSTFYRCSNLNIPIILPSNLLDFAYTFDNCGKYNQPTFVPGSVEILVRSFNSCTNLNSFINFNNGLMRNSIGLNAFGCFEECRKFNFPIKWSNIFDGSNAFRNCWNLNCPILIDDTAYNGSVNLSNMLRSSSNFEQNIIFMTNPSNTYTLNVCNMLNGLYVNKRKNIYTTDLSLFNITTTASVTGAAITWTATTNGYYNATKNIYLLNNVQDALTAFNTFYSQYL